ncbi:MAG: efflux RND transporter permease subunit, partial [Gammaproteobacteria bacterium]|nr:efflux RND transporter permease subunit [Gammaproteobacteria bacterium]
ELIFTISAAILASLLVAITLVPSLSARVRDTHVAGFRRYIDKGIVYLQGWVTNILQRVLDTPRWSLSILLMALLLLMFTVPYFFTAKQVFLPKMDEGQIRVSVISDPGMALDDMDKAIHKIEAMLRKDKQVQGVFSLVGGRIFGRSEYLSSNYSSLYIQLLPASQRELDIEQWIARTNKKIRQLQLTGVKVRMRNSGIRGVRTSRGSDDVSIRIQGPELAVLREIAEQVAERLRDVSGLRNIEHSAEELKSELAIHVDRERIARLGLSLDDVGKVIRIALEGQTISDFLENDRSYNIRMRLTPGEISNFTRLNSLIVTVKDKQPIYLADIAQIKVDAAPSEILRENQMRIIEVSASMSADIGLEKIEQVMTQIKQQLELPSGYSIYDSGMLAEMKAGQSGLLQLLLLALFLVLVVMAVQYESLRNPFIILAGVPFALTGVGLVLWAFSIPVSMPVWLGLIMLTGIVVNNAIVLLEYVDMVRHEVNSIKAALLEAVRLRLRPILMTTLTTIVGMMPLVLAFGDGAEMLRPLAITIVAGLSYSLLVSLFLIPLLYHYAYKSWKA